MQTSTRFDLQKSIYEILSISEVGLVILDENREIIWINSEFERWTGAPLEHWQGQNWMALPLEASDESGEVYCLLNTERTKTVFLHHWTALLPSDPKLSVHFFKTLGQESRQDRLAQIAAKLPKRPNWIQFLDYEVSRSRRYDNPLSLMKIKLVCFAALEDPKLEATLNQLLEAILKDELRWADMIGHSETGEFLLVLPETNTEQADALQHKLNQALQQQMSAEHPDCEYALLIGQAQWSKGDSSGILLDRVRDDLVTKMTQLMAKYQAQE